MRSRMGCDHREAALVGLAQGRVPLFLEVEVGATVVDQVYRLAPDISASPSIRKAPPRPR